MQISASYPYFAHQFRQALRFYLRARTGNDLHAPLAYSCWEALFHDRRWYYAFSEIETLREELSRNHTTVQTIDRGAGSRLMATGTRKVSDIVKSASLSPADGRRLFRLVQWYKPQAMLELGTSLGISTLYQQQAATTIPLISIEGCPTTAALARRHVMRFGAQQVQILNQSFEEFLGSEAFRSFTFDYWLVDGNHTREATLRYWDSFVRKAPERALFVLDDIHWSPGMTEAWNHIRSDVRCDLSVELFTQGLAFKHPGIREKQDYALVPRWMKPWRMGFLPPS